MSVPPTKSSLCEQTAASLLNSPLTKAPKDALCREVNGQYKRLIQATLGEQPVLVAKPKLWKGIPLSEKDRLHNQTALFEFAREINNFATCKSLSVEGIAYPILSFEYTAKDRTVKHRMVLRLYEGGDLTNFLKPINRPILQKRREIQRRLLEIGSELQKKKLVHRDIKLENFLLHGDKIDLCDISFLCPEKDPNPYFCGTFATLSPEYCFLQASRHLLPPHALTDFTVHKIDAFAIGIILCELENPSEATRLFLRKGALEIRTMWYRSGYNPSFLKPQETDPMMHLIWNLTHPDPSRRYSATEALKVFDTLRNAEETPRLSDETVVR